MMNSDDQPPSDVAAHRVRPMSPPEEIPVYNCLVLVTPRDADGLVRARAANLADISAAGKTEREALSSVVAAFKTAVAACHERGEPIAWREPPEAPQPGEQTRWIAVHL